MCVGESYPSQRSVNCGLCLLCAMNTHQSETNKKASVMKTEKSADYQIEVCGRCQMLIS